MSAISCPGACERSEAVKRVSCNAWLGGAYCARPERSVTQARTPDGCREHILPDPDYSSVIQPSEFRVRS
jgi:hypothetical protein